MQRTPDASHRDSARRGMYSVGYGPHAHHWHVQRNAAERANFLLPHLRPGMRLLDCGCGPGSITLGLAAVVAPGQVLGIDRERRQVERARSLAADQGQANTCLILGDLCALPFPDASFDAVFAHNVLEHLGDPLNTLREMHRVLKPGGVVGVRDPDYGAGFWVPSTPLLEETSRLLLRVREQNGGSPYYARHQRRLLREAGFVRVEAFGFVEYQGTPEATRAFADVLVEVLTGPATVDTALEQGWADRARLDALAAEVQAWAARPDAFRAVLECAALGWVADEV